MQSTGQVTNAELRPPQLKNWRQRFMGQLREDWKYRLREDQQNAMFRPRKMETKGFVHWSGRKEGVENAGVRGKGREILVQTHPHHWGPLNSIN